MYTSYRLLTIVAYSRRKQYSNNAIAIIKVARLDNEALGRGSVVNLYVDSEAATKALNSLEFKVRSVQGCIKRMHVFKVPIGGEYRCTGY